MFDDELVFEQLFGCGTLNDKRAEGFNINTQRWKIRSLACSGATISPGPKAMQCFFVYAFV